ncbi:hypothetical protein HPB50_014321 [Hyalomma asiaticum]|uniref:Uncharacterized protein n=1 Tax=Hyalomma asiaticum TaxID=266040 RepID=A0ACB7S8V5_HYAAI|nr:hypothetical protein HPB50_014321 [Hyalomma asiaticum]
MVFHLEVNAPPSHLFGAYFHIGLMLCLFGLTPTICPWYNCRCYGKTPKKQDPKEEDRKLVCSPTTQSKPCLELTGPLSGAGINREPDVEQHIVSQVEAPSREMLKKHYEIPSDKQLHETSASLAVEDGAYEHATACINLESAKVRGGELAKTLSPARRQSVDSCSEPGLLYPTDGETRLQKAQCGFPDHRVSEGRFSLVRTGISHKLGLLTDAETNMTRSSLGRADYGGDYTPTYVDNAMRRI